MSEPNEPEQPEQPDVEETDVAAVPEEWSADDLPGEAIHPAVDDEESGT